MFKDSGISFKNNCPKLASNKMETEPYLVNLLHFKTVPKQQLQEFIFLKEGEEGSKGNTFLRIKMKMC